MDIGRTVAALEDSLGVRTPVTRSHVEEFHLTVIAALYNASDFEIVSNIRLDSQCCLCCPKLLVSCRRAAGPTCTSSIAIRKDWVVVFSVYLKQRRKDLWGEDALGIRPERWEQRVSAWRFLPFLGGPRICIGLQIAQIEASYVLVRMVQQFDRTERVDAVNTAKMT